MGLYEIKARHYNGSPCTVMVLSDSAEAAVEKAERVCKVRVLTVWPTEWVSGRD